MDFSFVFGILAEQWLINMQLAIRVMIIKPRQNFVFCEPRFEKHLISRTQICNLKWQLNPVITGFVIYSAELLKSSSSLSTPVTKK